MPIGEHPFSSCLIPANVSLLLRSNVYMINQRTIWYIYCESFLPIYYPLIHYPGDFQHWKLHSSKNNEKREENTTLKQFTFNMKHKFASAIFKGSVENTKIMIHRLCILSSKMKLCAQGAKTGLLFPRSLM